MIERPEGIIITVGAKMYGHHGYRNWLRNFLAAMKESETEGADWFYWFRQTVQPRADVRDSLQYVYLCIGNKIRYRCFFAGSMGPAHMKFVNHTESMFGSAWVLVAGPVERAPFKIEQRGFRGFRYCEKLF